MSLIAASSVTSDLRNLRRAGTLANRSLTSTVAPGTRGPEPCSITSPVRTRMRIPALVHSTSETEAMLANASPRNPRLVMAARSDNLETLLVACRTKAIARSSAAIPAPSSLTRIEILPAPRTSMLIRRACASSAFSTSSLTTDAGRSMTSPAAMASATSGARRWIELTCSFACDPGSELVQLLQRLERAEGVRLQRLELLSQLVRGHLHGQAQLLLRWLQRPLALQFRQDLACSRDDGRRQPGQGCDVDSVRAVGAAGDDSMQETDRLAFFEDLDTLIAYARQPFSESGQLVVVSGEQRATAASRRAVQVLDDRLCNRESVVGRGPPPHLVQDHQRGTCRVVEDIRGLGHLDHKGRHTGGDVVVGAHASKDPVGQADDRALRRDEAPALRQQHDDGPLA